MGTLVYTAKRSLAAGHMVNGTYSIDVDVTEAVRSRSVQKSAVRSLGGSVEVLRNYADTQWHITFEPLSGARLEQLREFLDSTDAGEAFTLDIYGNDASRKTLKRMDDGYSEDPFMRRGSESTDVFTASITAIEV